MSIVTALPSLETRAVPIVSPAALRMVACPTSDPSPRPAREHAVIEAVIDAVSSTTFAVVRTNTRFAFVMSSSLNLE
jgi:hypothetical protein